MPVPRNNLDDALRRTNSNPTCSSKPKFKPAISTPDSLLTPAASSRKYTAVGLSSFSTPGFSTPGFSTPGSNQLPGTSLQLGVAHCERREKAIPSVATSSASGSGIKRTSSDPSVTSDPSPQLQKRLRHALVDEKENIRNNIEHKGKARALIPSESFLHSVVGDDEPWAKMPLDDIRDPWTKLDRDHPLPSSTLGNAAVSKKPHGLFSKSLKELRNLRVSNLEHHLWLTSEIIQHHRGTTKDIETLERHRLEVDERIRNLDVAIESIQARKQASVKEHCFHLPDEGQASLPAQPPRTPVVVPASISTPFRQEEGGASTSMIQKRSVAFYEDHASESDDGYWDGMDDIPTQLDEAMPKIAAKTTISAVATVTTSNGVHLTSTPYYSEVLRQLRKVFGLQSFRPNQLEAITATLEGHDVFVLMPTGGGKSLCYQLPALCRGGKTRGLTVVVTPLVALMKDQVDALHRKGINAFLWNSDTSQEEVQRHIYSGNFTVSLLYVTPEKLDMSGALRKLLYNLYKEDALARFVIDEAHCISTWGQDFRNSYQNLGKLRVDYPSVPIMALTATANRVTIDDIIKQLQLRNPVIFTQSFNRPNLRYIIKDKKKSIVNDILAYIQSEHLGHPGVIYCIGRETCERVAENLRQKGLRAAHFHAKLTSEDKDTTLADWQSGKVTIIVATIAFGMGIDKADVRFVIHYGLARSISGYYQETGRAGRDGEPADCVLYYSYQDFKVISRMIKDNKDREEAISQDAIARQIEAAQEVVKYCQNKSVCRRVQLLQFFGEAFNKQDCARGCDNCLDERETVHEDVTSAARNAVSIIQTLNTGRENVTLNQLQHILRGANLVEIRNKGFDKHPLYASAKDMPRELLEQMTRHLLAINVLEEVSVRNNSGYHNEYIELGPHAEAFVEDGEELHLEWRPSARPLRKVKKQPASNSRDASSAQSSKGKKRAMVLDEDPIELYEDDLLPCDASDSDNSIVEITERPANLSKRNNTSLAATAALDELNIAENSATPEQLLFQKMCSLRNEIMRRENLKDEEEVLNDNVLHCLSVTCPQDYAGLKNSLKIILDFTDDRPDASSQTNLKHKKYGQQFLNICIQHKLNPTGVIKESTSSFNAPELRSRFEYQGPAGSTKPVPSARKSKFKPAGV